MDSIESRCKVCKVIITRGYLFLIILRCKIFQSQLLSNDISVIRIFYVILAVLLSTAWSCAQLGISGDYRYDLLYSLIGLDRYGFVSGYDTCRTGSTQSAVDVIAVGSSALLTNPSASYSAAVMSLKEMVEN